MKNAAPLLVTGLAFLALMKGISLASRKPIKRIYLIGDSQVTQPNYPQLGKESWLGEILRRKTGAEVIVGAHGGWGVKRLRERFTRDILRSQPDVVVAWMGVNDIASNRSTEHVVEQLRRLKGDISPIKLVFVEVPPAAGYGKVTKARTDELNAAVRQKVDIPTINTEVFGDGGGNLKAQYTSDGLHFERPSKSLAYDMMGDLIIETLISL